MFKLGRCIFQTFNADFIRAVSPLNFYCAKAQLLHCSQISILLDVERRKRPKLPLLVFGGMLSFLGFKEKTEDEKESELITTLKRSILLIQKTEFKKAEQMLHIALKIAQEQKNHDGIIYVYDVMANLAYDTGDFKKAQKLFISVMQLLMASGVEANDNRILHISLKLSKIYETNGDKSKAEEGYKFCIDNLEHRVSQEEDRTEDTMLLWAMSLDLYAHYLLSENRLREAWACFRKAYDTCVTVNGKAHEQTVVLLNDLGTVSNLLGDLESAVSYFEEAVAIGEKLPNMKDLGSVYVNLGQIYFLKKMLSESEQSCASGRRSAIKHGDKETEEEANECLKEVKNAMKG